MSDESTLARLRAHSELVPETADLELAKRFRARHVCLSAARITAAAQEPQHAAIVDEAVAWAQRAVGKGGNRKLVAMRAVERLGVEFARHLMAGIDGWISLEVDGRLAYKRRQTIERARELVTQLEEAGVPRDRVLLKIPATWEGIEAAQTLRNKSGIGCHMTLVFGMHQLAACAEADADVIAPAIGRITDWHKKKAGVEEYPPTEDPGVHAATAMQAYLDAHAHRSRLMPCTFRNLDQALALSGCHLLALPPKLFELLETRTGEPSAVARPAAPDKFIVDAASFQAMNSADALSASKLSAGVKNMSWAVVSQEKQLVDWIEKRQDEAAETSTLALFRIWDYDGDGYIDREEWSGTEEVFNALDRDNNGRISLEEMAIGLGAPYKPDSS
ncbi:MAG TPA: transaldolase family protein [Polyangiaceae bacterium]|jgi:transaldolase|nr:transaldolase family protein [Polyangiaceae bacterium]